jgi:Glyoxalase-like domain
MQHIDHIAFAAADLDATAARLRDDYGLDAIASKMPAPGDKFQELLFIPLGRDQYLEVVPLSWSAPGGWQPEGAGWLSWSLRSDDFDGHLQKLGLEAAAPAAPPELADKVPVTTRAIRAAGLVESESSAGHSKPFFISKPPNMLDAFPGWRTPEHKQEPDGFAWITVSGDAQDLEQWVGEHTDEIRIVQGDPEIVSVAVKRLDGDTVEISPV